jgi:hypothetical protein
VLGESVFGFVDYGGHGGWECELLLVDVDSVTCAARGRYRGGCLEALYVEIRVFSRGIVKSSFFRPWWSLCFSSIHATKDSGFAVVTICVASGDSPFDSRKSAAMTRGILLPELASAVSRVVFKVCILSGMTKVNIQTLNVYPECR